MSRRRSRTAPGALVILAAVCLACSAPAARPAAEGAAPPSADTAAPSGGAQAPATVPERSEFRVLYGSVTGSMTPLWLAVEKGLFERYGLRPEVDYAESTVGTTAVSVGDAQLNVNEGVSATRAIAAGSPLKIIAYFNKRNPYSIVARPEIVTPADLRGKAIALLRPGDTTDVSARIALKPRGIVLGEDVQPLSAGNSPSRLAALLSGQVAAALLSEAFVDQAVGQGMHVLISLEKEQLPYISTGVLINTSFGRESPNTVVAFLKAMIEGTHLMADPANRDEVLPVMARKLKLDPADPAVADAYDFYRERLARDPYPDREGAETILDALRSIEPEIFASATPEQMLDPSYMAAIRASGFLESVWGQPVK